jgi:hypothetical protein
MAQSAAFIQVIRAHTKITDEEVCITFQAVWAHLEPDALSDINGVTLHYQRTVASSRFGPVEEFRLTVKGDMARCRIVQNVIIRTMRGDEKGRRALAFLANRQL